MKAKVVAQVGKKDGPLQFKFRAKFYPEDVGQELIQDLTVRLFYLQVKNAILTDEIYCASESSVLLASYGAQAKYGDYNKEVHTTGYLAKDRLLTQRVSNQHNLTREEWETRISTWHAQHQGMLKEEAMMEYLKVSQDLDMYGVNYFEIKNKKGTHVWLGIEALGLNVYDIDDKLTPKIGFPWSEIRSISYKDQKFIIRPTDKKAPNFVFKAPHLRINKRILRLCMGNHELFMKRRQPDTIEVQQMRLQATEERNSKEEVKGRLQKEIQAREAAERKQIEFAERLKSMQQEMERRQQELVQAQDTIRRLEEQLLDMQKAKEELEASQKELHAMLKLLEEAKEMETAERTKLEEEIRAKQEEVQRIADQVHHKDEETRRLQQEVEEARKLQEEAAAALIAATTPIPEPVEDCLTLAEKNQLLKDQLQMLKEELASTKDETKETAMDKLHKENVKQGREKYKTLRDIRSGNTKKRVDQFENM